MSQSLRSPSLFWTFAGAFLLVLLVAAVLQVAVLLAVVRPLSARAANQRSELLLEVAASQLESMRLPLSIGEVAGALPGPSRGRVIVVLRDGDGHLFSPFPIMGERGEHLLELAGATGDSVISTFGGPGRPGPRGPGDRQGRPGGRRGGDRDGPPGAPPFERDSRREMAVAARHAVTFADGATGELVAIAPKVQLPLWPRGAPRPLLIFLPLALLVAVGGGLVLFRSIVRRIQELETLATRVSEGNLGARVAPGRRDELGRLGERLNRMTESLEEARDRLESVDAQRRRLLGDISHELATPLTSIRGYTETMLNPDVSVSESERGRYLDSVLAEARRMDLLIQDLLDLARLESGAVAMEMERLDLAGLARNTIERLSPQFDAAQLKLVWVPHANDAWVEGDGRRLEQVLDNLLANALRYVPTGGTVQVSVEPTEHGAVRLSVADDGPGIAAEELTLVFDRFYRADPARGVGGTGLGLAIVREIVLRHGGGVEAAPNRPRGVVFRVELPGAS